MDLEIISMEQGSTFAHKILLESRMPALVDNIETNVQTGKSTLELSNFTRGYVDCEVIIVGGSWSFLVSIFFA